MLLLVAHILIALFTIVPGYLSIDEATYHMMAKNFSESGDFEMLLTTQNTELPQTTIICYLNKSRWLINLDGTSKNYVHDERNT